MSGPMIPSFDEWQLGAHTAWRGDPLWTVRAFRLAMYAIECDNADCASLATSPFAPGVDQLTRAVGSVGANIAEGYSRASSAERVRFYNYALGSTREAITWYGAARPRFGPTVADRQAVLIQIRRLLLTTLRRMRPAGGIKALRDSHGGDG